MSTSEPQITVSPAQKTTASGPVSNGPVPVGLQTFSFWMVSKSSIKIKRHRLIPFDEGENKTAFFRISGFRVQSSALCICECCGGCVKVLHFFSVLQSSK